MLETAGERGCGAGSVVQPATESGDEGGGMAMSLPDEKRRPKPVRGAAALAPLLPLPLADPPLLPGRCAGREPPRWRYIIVGAVRENAERMA